MMAKKKKNQEPVKATPAPMRRVTHRGYTAVQSPRNNHIMIGKAGKMVYHSQYDKPLTEEGLRKAVDDFIQLRERLVETPCIPS